MDIALAILIVFFAFVVRSLVGFGSALISIPLLALLFDLKFVVPIEALLEVIISVIFLPQIIKKIDYKALIPLVIWGSIGSILGIYVLQISSNMLLKRLLGLVISISAVVMYLSRRAKSEETILKTNNIGWIAGLLGGGLGGAFGQSGPIYALYLSSQIRDKERLRASLIGLFLIDYGWRFGIYAYNGLVDQTVLYYSAIFIPVIIISSLIGSFLLKRITTDKFEGLVYLIIVCSGLLNFFL